jgi:hypothetical protein
VIVDSSSTQISRRTRVLVADDTDSVRALFQKLLTADGHEVICAEDGIGASTPSTSIGRRDSPRRRHAGTRRYRGVPEAEVGSRDAAHAGRFS